MELVHAVKDLTRADAGVARDAAEDPVAPAPVGIACVRHVGVECHMSQGRPVTKWPALPVGIRWRGNEEALGKHHRGTSQS